MAGEPELQVPEDPVFSPASIVHSHWVDIALPRFLGNAVGLSGHSVATTGGPMRGERMESRGGGEGLQLPEAHALVVGRSSVRNRALLLVRKPRREAFSPRKFRLSRGAAVPGRGCAVLVLWVAPRADEALLTRFHAVSHWSCPPEALPGAELVALAFGLEGGIAAGCSLPSFLTHPICSKPRVGGDDGLRAPGSPSPVE